MQKSMKRLLSVLAVLALVLTMAPAGILAVETKAEGTEPEYDYTQTNWAEAVADGGLAQNAVKTEQDKQTAAKGMIGENLEGATEKERLDNLNAKKLDCPFCGAKAVKWTTLAKTPGGTGWALNYLTENSFKHIYVYGDFSGAESNRRLLHAHKDNMKGCLLMDNANIQVDGSIHLEKAGGVLNIGGTGEITSTLAGWPATDTSKGLFLVEGASTLNLYGGTFNTNAGTTLPMHRGVLRVSNDNAEVNIWTDDVVIGPENPTAPNATTDAGKMNALVYKGTLNMYGGTIRNGYALFNYQGWNVMLQTATAKFNMYDGTITGGSGRNVTGVGTRGANVCQYAAGAEFNMYGGTISSGRAAYGGNVSVGTGTANIKGGLITDGTATSGGGNIFVGAGSLTTGKTKIVDGDVTGGSGGNIYMSGSAANLNSTSSISAGEASSYAGNVYVYGSAANVTIACDLTGGHANMAGNFAVAGGASVILDGATISDGTINTDSQIQYNGRVDAGTLILKNDANCVGGIMFVVDATSVLKVDKTFNGEVTIWQNGETYKPGDSVRNFICQDAFPGIVRNGNMKVASAVSDLKDVYASFAMVWDGASGLKCPAQGVVYNGTLTPAASGQAAVDAYVAAMADEELEEKPQYVYITEDVQLKDGAEVAIWAGADITVSGNGVVAGVDRKNDNYAANGATITVADQVTVAKEVTAGGRRYIALSDATVDANKYTFHRVETKLTNVTVNVANAGIYYKAEYQFDEIVKDRIASYGVNVNLEGYTKGDQTSSSNMSTYDAENHTLTASSHGVYGVFKVGKASNMEDGKIKLCGNPYLAINTTNNKEASDCPEFTAAESVNMSMADAMEMANEKWDRLTEEGKTNLKQFFAQWLEEGAWDAAWAAELTNLYPTEA